ncbi:DNA-binding IclR family transcriptional regulator [Amycolatopsis bartoniae]|uniref:Transcriptional regulator n=1 Tax=Amycolatopsis bartoniae TaxID=941986 RepID=A0A8H9ISA4_9PSEU|nr:IclR family transcriptional regulator [Amycolatopsis bartoniae]MBB2933058.1 DNA-binding IclR family transcriptional regulator [Amycolatopsis bartoniae]TVT11929.1 IclR family transcriptional regulator [Amycolatopsis bartoniae]GHF56732.1 transcriptional regulator [Amycolatopsis bartoniae]
MPRLVPAVLRAADVLELFLGSRATLTAAEIGRHLGLPRSTTHELLSTLVERRYLDRHETTYRLGPVLLELGSRYRQRLEFSAEADAVARSVAARCGETVHVGILDGLDVVYVSKIDSTHPVRLISAVGHRLPAHCTAVGKVLLAGLPREDLLARLKGRKLAALTEHSVTARPSLLAQLDEIRVTEVAHERSESNPDAGCVAAPVVDADGEWVAAMSISVPTSRHSPEAWTGWEDLVREGAAELSARLGYATGTARSAADSVEPTASGS